MEEARIKEKSNRGKRYWEIEVIKKGVSYYGKVYAMKDITAKLEEMAMEGYISEH